MKVIASQDDKQIITKEINKKADCLCGKEIVIFGCTLYAQDIRDALLEEGLGIQAFVENNV